MTKQYDTILPLHQGDLIKCDLNERAEDGASVLPTGGRIGKVRLCVILSCNEAIDEKFNIWILPCGGHAPTSDRSGISFVSSQGVSYPVFNAIQMISRNRICGIYSRLTDAKFAEINNYVHGMHYFKDDVAERLFVANNELRAQIEKLEAIIAERDMGGQDTYSADKEIEQSIQKDDTVANTPPIKLLADLVPKKQGMLSQKIVKDTWTAKEASDFLTFVDDPEYTPKQVRELFNILNTTAYHRIKLLCREKIK